MASIFTFEKSLGVDVARCSAVKNSFKGEMVASAATMSFGTTMLRNPYCLATSRH